MNTFLDAFQMIEAAVECPMTAVLQNH
jgi:hypothetical protein